MNTAEKIYKQRANIDFVKNTMGRELWVQVAGHKTLNGADAGFWAYLIPVNHIDESLKDVCWDSLIGTQGPGFMESGRDISYDRLSFTGDRYENIVNFREFYGVKPDYTEFVEEFRLLNNLYHDTKTNSFLQIQENGECIEVAKIENESSAFVKLKYLLNYAAARQMALCLCFDIRTKIPGTIPDNGLAELNEEYSDDSICYDLYGQSDSFFKTTYSRLLGKKIFRPKPVEKCGYWPYEPERTFADYIIGIDEEGEPKRCTSDPDQLSNYFGANPGAPHYLTPVFFKKEVLQKYLSHPDLYTVRDGQIDCQSLWGMPIDNNHKDCVVAYLGDLGKRLPAAEQSHWQQYNIASSESLSTVAFKRDFCCIPSDPIVEDLKFKQNLTLFSKNWRERYGWDLFLPLSEQDEYNIRLLHTPLTESQEEFDHQVLSLVKTIIDSLNEKELVKQLPPDIDTKGGIGKFEKWLSEKLGEGFEPHIKFLRNLQELRSTGTGHRKGKGYEKIKKEFGLDQSNTKDVFNHILSQANDLLDFLTKSFLC